MIKLILIISMVMFSMAHSAAQLNYPVPAKNADLLFYAQRSHNRNTVIYNINRMPNGKINQKDPVHVFWIRYEENSQTAELTFLQRRAFGISFSVMEHNKENFILHFNSFKLREIYLFPLKENVYKAYIRINGEMCEFEKYYVKSENNALGMPLAIGFVEITGISLKNGQQICERIIP